MANDNGSECGEFSIEQFLSQCSFRELSIDTSCVYYHAVMDSTMDQPVDTELLDKRRFLVVIAGNQVKGKGQNLKRWQSAGSNQLYVTIHAKLTNCPLNRRISLGQCIAAVAIHNAVRCLLAKHYDRTVVDSQVGRLQIKWPNDVYVVDAGKIAGILCKASMFGDNQPCIIQISIGVNLYCNAAFAAIEDVLPTGEKLRFGREELLAEILRHLDAYLPELETRAGEMTPEIVDSYCDRMIAKFHEAWFHRGKTLMYDSKHKLFAKAIDQYGRLVLSSSMSENDHELRIIDNDPDDKYLLDWSSISTS